MASIKIHGWIAEGGYQIYQGSKHKVLVFDVVEDDKTTKGIEFIDDFNTNHAWFHCCLENVLEESANLTIIPPDYTLMEVSWKGYCRLCRKDDDTSFLPGRHPISIEQTANYIVEGKWVTVEGHEVLVRGENGKLLRIVKVIRLSFDDFFEEKKPKLLSVPYKSSLFVNSLF